MIVLVMLSLAGALALPRIDFRGWRLNGAVREVTGLLRGARQTAVRQQHDVRVIFDAASNVITIHENTDGDRNGQVVPGERIYRRPLPEAVVFGPPGAPAVRGRGGFPSSFKSGVIVFHANGAASESGVIYLAPQAWSGETDDMRAIWVERSTGSAQALRRRGSEWAPL
jgi:Tfp pilus assembly protein FimT